MEKRKRKQAERRRGGPEHISGPLAEVLRRYGIGKAESGESRAESQKPAGSFDRDCDRQSQPEMIAKTIQQIATRSLGPRDNLIQMLPRTSDRLARLTLGPVSSQPLANYLALLGG